jgi:hypothetical protein|nr:MAG TPA: hypothetical protein [Caudoviricetes sp.]
MAKINTSKVLNNITKGLTGILDDVAEEGFEKKLRGALKDIGYKGTSSNGKSILKFAGNNIDDVSEEAIGKLYNIIDKNGIKNIDDLRGYTKSIVNKEAVGKNTLNVLSRDLDMDPASIKSILRKKGIKSNENLTSEALDQIVKTSQSTPSRIVKETAQETAEETVKQAAKDLKGSAPNTSPAPDHKQLKKARYDSADDYMKYKQSQQYEEVFKAFKEKDFENPLLKELKINSSTTMDEIQGMRAAGINSANKNDMGFVDFMGYNKIPQIATGVAGTAWLVNKMAATGGQQTNSQLYGQTPY